MPRRTSGYRRGGFSSPFGEVAPRHEPDTVGFDMYATVKGRMFGAWVDADSRNNGYNQNDLIENPVYVAESIFRDILGLTSTIIDYANLDEAGNTTDGKRDDWKVARSLRQQDNSLNYITSLMEDSACVSIRDSANKEKIVALDNYTPELSLGSPDLVRNQNGKPMVRAYQAPPSQIFNEFFLNYRVSEATGKMGKQLFVTATDNNLASNTRSDKSPLNTFEGMCDTSQDYYNLVQRMTYDADWIRDDATAELFIKFLVDWLAFRKWFVEAKLWFNPTTMRLELMDQVKWSLSLLPVSLTDSRIQGLTAVGSITGGSLAADDYYYVITATDIHGETQASIQKTGTVASGTTGSVALAWTALTGATGYRVYRSTTSGDFASAPYYDVATNSLTDTGAAADGTGTPPGNGVAWFVTNLIYYPREAQISAKFLAVPLISRPALSGYGEAPYGDQYGYTGF